MNTEIMNNEDEIVVKLFDYKGKSYYIDAANVIYDFISLNKVGKLVGDKIIFTADTLTRLMEISRVDERIDTHIKCRDKWMDDTKKQDKEHNIHAFGIMSLIKDMDVKMAQIEKLIYKSLISNKRALISKYKEKYLSHTQQALEFWENLTQMGAEDDGKYLLEANRLKESYDFISLIIAQY